MNCGILTGQGWIYVLSLAFQVSGAVLLIIKYCGNTKDRIIDEYFPGSNIVIRDKKDNTKLEKKKIQKCAQIIYDNRAAFIFIAIGYILTIFGDSQEKICKIYILGYVIVLTIVLIVVEKSISIIISKVIYKNDISIAYSEIEDIVDTLPTEDEMDEIFNNVFNDKHSSEG